MIVGKIAHRADYAHLTAHPVWHEAFAWLERYGATVGQGIHELRGKEIYANVHGYDTRPRAECRYEAHRVYVDLQYCIAGGEIVEWHPREKLAPRGPYAEGKDVTHYDAPPVPEAAVRMLPGTFAIFFPEDGHMPKVADGISPRVDKLVIKIDRALLP